MLLVVLRSATVAVLPKANDWSAPEPRFSELSKLAFKRRSTALCVSA